MAFTKCPCGEDISSHCSHATPILKKKTDTLGQLSHHMGCLSKENITQFILDYWVFMLRKIIDEFSSFFLHYLIVSQYLLRDFFYSATSFFSHFLIFFFIFIFFLNRSFNTSFCSASFLLLFFFYCRIKLLFLSSNVASMEVIFKKRSFKEYKLVL